MRKCFIAHLKTGDAISAPQRQEISGRCDHSRSLAFDDAGNDHHRGTTIAAFMEWWRKHRRPEADCRGIHEEPGFAAFNCSKGVHDDTDLTIRAASARYHDWACCS